MIKNYNTVYDITTEGPALGWVIPTIFAIAGIIVILTGLKKKNSERLRFILVGSIMTLIATSIVTSFLSAYADERKLLLRIYRYKLYQITEGQIENFDPMPKGGHKSESFTVNEIPFSYNLNTFTNIGFSHAASHGGPIYKNGQLVRITYITNHNPDRNKIFKTNHIIKLELIE